MTVEAEKGSRNVKTANADSSGEYGNVDVLEDQIDLPLIKERLAQVEREGTISWESIKAEH